MCIRDSHAQRQHLPEPQHDDPDDDTAIRPCAHPGWNPLHRAEERAGGGRPAADHRSAVAADTGGWPHLHLFGLVGWRLASSHDLHARREHHLYGELRLRPAVGARRSHDDECIGWTDHADPVSYTHLTLPTS